MVLLDAEVLQSSFCAQCWHDLCLLRYVLSTASCFDPGVPCMMLDEERPVLCGGMPTSAKAHVNDAFDDCCPI
jgi:hypothetical protein